MHNRRNTRRSARRTARGGMAPYPDSLYAKQNQPSYDVMDWATNVSAKEPSPYEMKYVVARGGARRKRSHKRRRSHKHGKRHTRR